MLHFVHSILLWHFRKSRKFKKKKKKKKKNEHQDDPRHSMIVIQYCIMASDMIDTHRIMGFIAREGMNNYL